MKNVLRLVNLRYFISQICLETASSFHWSMAIPVWSLSYYHLKLKLNEIGRSRMLRKALQLSETWLCSTIRLQSSVGAICICTQTPSLTMAFSPMASGYLFVASSDGTFCKAFSACLWSCLTCLPSTHLLKYKQIQADTVQISLSIKHSSSTCHVHCQEPHHRKT